MPHPVVSPTGGLVGAIVFGIVLVSAWAVFGLRVTQLVRMMLSGRPENRFDHLGERIQFFILMVLGQRGVLRDPLPGIAHFFTFWGFIILQIDALNLWANGFGFSLPVVDSPGFAIATDLMIALVFVALVEFAFRRLVLRPRQLESQSHSARDGLIILGLIFLVILTLAIYEIFAYRASAGAIWSPFGLWLSGATSGIPVAPATALMRVFWWANVLVVMTFLIYIPYSKHLHLLATPFNVFFKNFGPRAALQPIENLEERDDYGVSTVTQFTWKQLLDGYACTECGRCNSVCPALATDKPLWPKEIILGVKEELFASAAPGGMPLAGHPEGVAQAKREPMVGGTIKEVSLWACTNCGACVEICPVSIEHVQKIEDMRRHLVMEESSFPQEVVPLFNNLERNQNPWEISNDTRAEWARAVGVKTLAEDPEVEVLYWVGCMGSFDARNRKVATAFAKVMQAAGVRFGILGPEESCTGDPARRIGNEYLYQMLAQQNIEVLDGYGFNTGKSSAASDSGPDGAARTQSNGHAHGSPNGHTGVGVEPGRAYNVKTVAATCPHCFNAIKNEYPQLGGNYEVVHHTQLIDRLIASGQLKLPEGFDRRKLTYHDPCFVGRWNDVYDEPRRVLNVISQDGVTEMKRNRNRSFCCGGGGGRVWMEEKIGKRINNTRVEEALSTGADALAAACPFCITMFEDGIKNVAAQDHFGVEDIAEILARALDAAPATASAPAPQH